MRSLKLLFITIFYKNILRPVLFLQDPEKVHEYFTNFGNFLGRSKTIKSLTSWIFNFQHPSLKQKILDISFQNPVGLSAGFDKDANLTNILQDVGFGFMQVGTLTDKAYKGNPKPRLYRLPRSHGLVVYYGLKNIGVKKIIRKISIKQSDNFPLSISVGKTNSPKTATTKTGINDYFQCLKKLAEKDIGDFYTINISCPNTFGGEPFTTPKELTMLLTKLYSIKISKPIFLKMPINLNWNKFKILLDIALKFKVDGVVIGNLNKNHQDNSIKDNIPSHVKGGISGKPTWDLSNNLISKTYKHYADRLIIIGVGGIFSPEDAYEKIKLGASLVQLITGMIYQGPQLIGEINQGLVDLLNKEGHKNISQAIGAYHNN